MTKTVGFIRDEESGELVRQITVGRRSISANYLVALQSDFEQFGPQAIENLRVEKPEAYLKLIAQLMPEEKHAPPQEVASFMKDITNNRKKIIDSD